MDAILEIQYSGRTVSGQNGPPPEVVPLDGWSGPTETFRSTFKNFRFRPTLLSSSLNFGRNANGSFQCD